MNRESPDKRLLSIVAAALDRSPADRVSFVEQAAKGDTALKRSIMAVLDQETVATKHESAASSHRATVAQPVLIGDYRIVSILGKGGFGVVYEAEQRQPRRTVALKVIRADAITENLRRRFELALQRYPDFPRSHCRDLLAA